MAWFLCCFSSLSSSFRQGVKNYHKVKTRNSSALKFGTLIVDITAHVGTKFGLNTVNTRKVMCNYSRKMTPICCHVHRVNGRWHEAENQYRGG